MPDDLPAVVKWGKQRFTGVRLRGGMPVAELKRALQALSGVPPERQKLCPGAWKGALPDSGVLGEVLALKPGQTALTIMLVGAADEAPAAPAEPTTFTEDLTPAEAEAAGAAAEAAAMAAAEGMITALPPSERAESVGAPMSSLPVKYSFLVHGLAQDQIEESLRRRRGSQGGALLDVCAMTLGHELGKAYVNAIATLADGTLASGLDNGRIALWRHGRRVKEAVHASPSAPSPRC